MDKKMIYYEGITHWTRRNDEQTWFINTTFIFALQSTLNYPLADYPGCGLSMLAKKELKQACYTVRILLRIYGLHYQVNDSNMLATKCKRVVQFKKTLKYGIGEQMGRDFIKGTLDFIHEQL